MAKVRKPLGNEKSIASVKSSRFGRKINFTLRIRELEQRVRKLESLLETRHVANGVPDGDIRLLDVVRLTGEMFPGSAIVAEVESDPEEPNEPFVIFNVQCKGDATQIIAKQIEWHQRLSEIPPGSSGTLRLCVSPL